MYYEIIGIRRLVELPGGVQRTGVLLRTGALLGFMAIAG